VAPYVQHGVVTLMGSASLSVDEMLGMADNPMHSAKEEGKNGIEHGIVDA
jgi:PleD family two-component response regulator